MMSRINLSVGVFLALAAGVAARELFLKKLGLKHSSNTKTPFGTARLLNVRVSKCTERDVPGITRRGMFQDGHKCTCPAPRPLAAMRSPGANFLRPSSRK